MDTLKDSLASWQYFIWIGFVFLGMAIFRAINVPITHDEAITLMEYVPRYFATITAMDNSSANNHILNTLLTKFMISIFGHAPLAVRASNLLGYILFLVCSARICRISFRGNKLFEISTFLLLNLHPFLFEFWSLCRGYGLAIAFMSGSILYILRYSEDKRTSRLIAGLLCSIAAVYSNLPLLNFHFGIIAVLLLLMIRSAPGKRAFVQTISAILGSTLLLFALIYRPIRALISAGELYYGGKSGFIQDTIRSLVSTGLYENEKNASVLTSIITCLLAFILFLIAVHTLIIIFHRKKGERYEFQFTLNILLLTPVLSVIAQHILLGNLYLIDRTALFYIPLFIFAAMHYLFIKPSLVKHIAISLLLAVAAINFLMHINFKKTLMWSYNLYEKNVLERISRTATGIHKIRLRADWIYAPPFQYYASIEHYKNLDSIRYINTDVGADTSYDYYFINSRHVVQLSPIYVLDTAYEGKYYLMKKTN